MAMMLDLDDELAAALRARAEIEGSSALAVAVKAIEEYIGRHSRHDGVDRALDRVLSTYADSLRRLGQS